MGQFDNVRTDAIALKPSQLYTQSNSSKLQNNDNASGVMVVLDVSSATVGVNEVQNLTVDATGGTFTMTFGANTTSALQYNADAATIESALRGLPSIGGTNVAVTPNGPDKTITFQQAKGGQDVGQITTDSSQLTGGATHTATITTTTQGAAGTSITLSINGRDIVSGKEFTILTGAKVTATSTNVYRVYPGLTAAANATVNDVLPKVWSVTVTHDNNANTTYSVGATTLA